MVYFSFVLLALAAAAGLLVIRAARQLSDQRDSLARQATQAVEALELQRLRRHTIPTLEMIEDLQAVLIDVEGELRESARVALARVRKARSILETGRPGPYSYQSLTTADRPSRPVASVKLWQG